MRPRLHQWLPFRVVVVGMLVFCAFVPVQAESLNEQVQDVSKALAHASQKIVEYQTALRKSKARLVIAQGRLSRANAKEAGAIATYNRVNETGY